MLPLRRLIYRFYRLFSGTRYRVRRRFTQAGLAVLGGAIVAGALGLDMSGSLAYQACTLLLCLLAASWVCAWNYRVRFTAARRLPRFATAGVPLSYRVVLRNQTPAVQRGLVLLENLADPRPNLAGFVALQQAEEKRVRSFSLSGRRMRWNFELARVAERPVPPVGPGQEAEVTLQLTPLRRGQIRFTGLTVARPDPLGLVKAFARVALPQTLLVLPRRYPLPPIALPGSMKYQPGGVAMASSVGESEEYVALRDYRHGDPLRRIHWRSWARAGRPIVKEFQDEFFVRHALVLDTFLDHPHSDAFEEAVSVAASFASTIQTQESLLDLLFVGPQAYCFTSGRGLAHTDQMLEILASVRVCREKPFELLEDLVLNHLTRVSGCICVLLSWDARRQEFVRKLRLLGVPLLVLVVSEPDAPEPKPGPLQDDPQSFRVLRVGAVPEGLARL